MWDMNDVIGITYVGGYTYHVTFDDGLRGEIYFSEYPEKGPVFAPLKELGFFRKAFIEDESVAQPNEADVAPESLYEKLLQKEQNRKCVGRQYNVCFITPATKNRKKKLPNTSLILIKAKRNEESILLQKKEFWILHFVQNNKQQKTSRIKALILLWPEQ